MMRAEAAKLGLRRAIVASLGHNQVAKSPPDDDTDKMMTNSRGDCQLPSLPAELGAPPPTHSPSGCATATAVTGWN